MSKIEWKPVKVRLSDLDHWKDNPVTLSEAQAKKLLKSEKTLGKAQAFSVSPKKKSGKRDLYDGHQRCNVWGAAYGMDTVVNAVESSRFLTDKERRRMAVMTRTATGSLDTSIISGWDSEELFDFGYDADLLKDMKNAFGGLSNFIESEEPEPVDAEPQINRAEELQKVWGTKLGQLWQIGEHRLLVGDCTVRENVERLMGGEKAQAQISDPPFAVRNDKWDTFDNSEAFISFTAKWLGFGKEYCDVVVSFMADKSVPMLLEASERVELNYRRALIWRKPAGSQFAGASLDGFWYDFEIIQVFGKPTFKPSKETKMAVLEHRTVIRQEHGAEKPVGLLQDLINGYSEINNSVVDLFGGTGTVMIACNNLCRKCRMMEISPAYAAVCLQRMADAFGITGVLIDEKE